jgi:hypothetical protein
MAEPKARDVDNQSNTNIVDPKRMLLELLNTIQNLQT